MEKSIIVIDGFYEDPNKIREHALGMDFTVEGNYPGHRTMPLTEGGVREFLEATLNIKIDETFWNESDYTGTFQYVTQGTNTWIHADKHTDWSCLVYLHPYPAKNSGTSFYKHKKTGSMEWNDVVLGDTIEEDGNNWDKWIKTDTVANRYNRALLFRGKMWHAADDYFGNDFENGRLFQTFFFDEVKE